MRRACLALLVALAGCGSEGDAREPAPATRPVALTSAKGPFAHLRDLAALTQRAGGTRVSGEPGYARAADHVAATLQAAGYRVRRQSVPFPFFVERGRPDLALVGGRVFRPGRDVRTMLYSGSGEVTGPIRAIGLDFGRASDAGCARRDFSALRRGEVAVVQRGECLLAIKARNAKAAGAAAVLIANDGRPGRTGAIPGTLGGPSGIPALAVSTAAGRALAGAAGRPVRVRVDAVSERRRADNVIADGPPATGSRVVMAGAHLDSVAEGPGTNDNGSGVAALLAIAERLRRTPGLRFGFWAGEELALYGSRRYVRSLSAAERRRITAYVNLDMVGSPRPRAFVYDSGNRIERVLRTGVRAEGRQPRPTDVDDASDHAPFAGAGIAVGGLFTGAGAPYDRCYHRRCDTLANIDRAMLGDMTRAATRALRALAP